MTEVPFLPARAKLWIGSLDDPTLEVRAQYNPKELQIDKDVPWEDHKNRTKEKLQLDQDDSKQSDLEFNGAPKRSMSLELLFDTYELLHDLSVAENLRTVEADVRALEEMSSIVLVKDGNSEVRRPHHCIVVWGSGKLGIRPFRCVIVSLAVKYTMFDPGGMPVRATCTVKLKEALKMVGGKEPEKEYKEKRRSAGSWDRVDPTEEDKWGEAKYAADAKRRLEGPPKPST